MILKIGGHKVKLIFKELVGSSGEYDTVAGTITIDPNYSRSIQGATFIHELLHAINSTLDEIPMGHALLDSLAEQIYQALSDNKLLNEDRLFGKTKRHTPRR